MEDGYGYFGAGLTSLLCHKNPTFPVTDLGNMCVCVCVGGGGGGVHQCRKVATWTPAREYGGVLYAHHYSSPSPPQTFCELSLLLLVQNHMEFFLINWHCWHLMQLAVESVGELAIEHAVQFLHSN